MYRREKGGGHRCGERIEETDEDGNKRSKEK